SLQAFLDMARPPTMQRRPVALRTLLENVYDLLHARAAKQGVVAILDVPDSLTIVADAEQLRQVFVNLCLNTLDAMPHGGMLSVCVRPSGPAHVRVEVSDTGPGIAEPMLTRLFEPFASDKDTGLGLGLVNSKRIIVAH